MLGPTLAKHVWALAHGIDHRPVVTEHEEKSISAEHTYAEDCHDPEIIHQTIVRLVERVGQRLRRSKKKARTAQIRAFND